MTKDDIFQEIRSGRRWRFKGESTWLFFNDLTNVNSIDFYQGTIDLEPQPEKTFTESQIKETYLSLIHKEDRAFLAYELMDELGIKT